MRTRNGYPQQAYLSCHDNSKHNSLPAATLAAGIARLDVATMMETEDCSYGCLSPLRPGHAAAQNEALRSIVVANPQLRALLATAFSLTGQHLDLAHLVLVKFNNEVQNHFEVHTTRARARHALCATTLPSY